VSRADDGEVDTAMCHERQALSHGSRRVCVARETTGRDLNHGASDGLRASDIARITASGPSRSEAQGRYTAAGLVLAC